jgi:hypothetical protein
MKSTVTAIHLCRPFSLDSPRALVEHDPCRKEGGPFLPRRIPKEIRVSALTVFGVLSTVGIGLVLRRIPALDRLVLTGQDAFVIFNIYGLAFSLIASASTVMRRRDTTILILAATVMWGVFVAREMSSEMIRFLLFASLITIGLRIARGRAATASSCARIGLSTLMGGVMAGIGGMVYYGLGVLLGAPESATAGGVAVGLLWGLSLGLAVNLGVASGSEVMDCITAEGKL